MRPFRTGARAKTAVIVSYYRELLRFLNRALNNREAAADLAQESYARVLAAQQAGQTITEPRALLYRTARNLMVDQHRRATVRGTSVAWEDQGEDVAALAAPAANEPEAAAMSAQHVQALLTVIDGLPLRCREAFILHKFDGLSQAEVARQMGISLTMVERHIKHALQLCRQRHDALHDVPPASPRKAR